MAKTTMYRAAKELGIPLRTLRYHIAHSRVTCERMGGVYAIDPDIARQELEKVGYFERSAAYWDKMMARAVARSRAGQFL